MDTNDYPALFQAADRASVSAQKQYMLSFAAYSGFAIAGASFSIAGINSKEAALVAALIFLAGLFTTIYMALKKNESIWYKTRAVAESVKTASWRFMMGAEPFEMSISGVYSREKFRKLLGSILSEHKELAESLACDNTLADQLSERMVNIRSKSLVDRKDIYQTERILEQREWYSKKSRMNWKHGTLWFWALVIAQCLAVTLTIMRIAYPSWKYWPTEIFVVAGSSMIAWIQLKRFRELAASYSLAAQEIGLAQVSLAGVVDDESFSAFVRDTENAFSREHTQWVAKKE